MENHDYGAIFDALYLGAWIIPPLVLSLFFAWKAIEWLRDRGKVDGTAVEESKNPWDQAISRPAADNNWGPALGGVGGELGGLGSMSQREQEELFSTYAPRKVRKEMQRRRRAREQAQKTQSDS